ncbi:hypothetical protein EXIGLDRAFT_519700 [Exidia glandulosa HHB12029]|uniref:HMG box domain-containing protein n=1 Tax=Exidia glandulosa HHB12029 TaxID=1314781 RepID=A0A166AQZ9_EXIGL|nr:hypothetical protein EXIGLDRAFT_519700 [Exidia glandulosa HHB12029]
MPRVARKQLTGECRSEGLARARLTGPYVVCAVDPANASPHSGDESAARCPPELEQRILAVLYAIRDGRVPQPIKKPHTAAHATGHVKRPKNKFMMFRSAVHQVLNEPGGAQQDISKRAAAMWRALPDDSPVRLACTQMALADAAQHRVENPNYKYAPRAKGPRVQSKSSSRRRRNAGRAADSSDDEDEYVALDGEVDDAPVPALPTLRARRTRRSFAEEDEEEAKGVDSDSGATAVGQELEDEKHSMTSPSPSLSSIPSVPMPATPLHVPAVSIVPAPFFGTVDHESGINSLTPSPIIKIEPLDDAFSPLRPGKSQLTCIPVEGEWSDEPFLPDVCSPPTSDGDEHRYAFASFLQLHYAPHPEPMFACDIEPLFPEDGTFDFSQYVNWTAATE